MKRIIVFVFILMLAILPVRADEVYDEQYSLSGAGELADYLDGDAREFLSENGIDSSNENWVNSMSAESVFGHIKNFLANGAQRPLYCGAVLLGIILIFAAVKSFDKEDRYSLPADFACTVSAAAVITASVWQSVFAASNAIKGSSTFMLAFVPIFASLVALSGGVATSVSMSAVLLASAQTVSLVSSFAVLPLMGGYLAVSICGSVSGIKSFNIADAIKKLSIWAMSLVSTVFLGVLGIQTVVNSAADSLALKTTKFIVGTSVPVAGAALSEAASAVTASVTLLKSSVGIYGIVALAVVLLPITLEIVLWRAVLTVCSAIGDALSCEKIPTLLRSVDGMLSVLLGILALVAATFIISLAVVISVGRVT